MIFLNEDGITLRSIDSVDIPILQSISLGHIHPEVQFYVYSTIVAECDGKIVGFTQFCLTPDGILHSLGMALAPEARGRGIGTKLMEMKEKLACEANAKHHYYAISKESDGSLRKILLHLGMHLCLDYPNIEVYAKGLINAPTS